jgi:glycosyltransferase involved in cell wall biosynthesis
MNNPSPTIHVALPAKNELGYIEHTISCIQNQTLPGFHTWICVNQPESFWDIAEKQSICENNAETLNYLKQLNLPRIHILDCSSRGKGWQGKNIGVGIARKTIMDAIIKEANDHDIIVSMDADTVFGENYLGSILHQFAKHPGAMGLSNPYYHPLGENPVLNRAVLRYEIYMRYYALNMRFTGTPYCFTPLGSAMAAPVWAYKKINGLTPKKSGEDFYFLQKLAKAGKVLTFNEAVVYPGTRLSDRVFFGTGPAMIKGIAGQWSSYPLFNLDLFDKVRETIRLFPALFTHSLATPMDGFLKEQFRCDDIFEPLRANCKDVNRFVKSCHEKIDGLRILQYLKVHHELDPQPDEENLRSFIHRYFPSNNIENKLEQLNFNISSIESIDIIRNFLFETEMNLQQQQNAT